MPCYMVHDGVHQEVTDHVFDAMVQALNTSNINSKSKNVKKKSWWKLQQKTTGWRLFQNILSTKSIITK